MPIVSISITVLKALKDKPAAGERKFPAAPEIIQHKIIKKQKTNM